MVDEQGFPMPRKLTENQINWLRYVDTGDWRHFRLMSREDRMIAALAKRGLVAVNDHSGPGYNYVGYADLKLTDAGVKALCDVDWTAASRHGYDMKAWFEARRAKT